MNQGLAEAFASPPTMGLAEAFSEPPPYRGNENVMDLLERNATSTPLQPMPLPTPTEGATLMPLAESTSVSSQVIVEGVPYDVGPDFLALPEEVREKEIKALTKWHKENYMPITDFDAIEEQLPTRTNIVKEGAALAPGSALGGQAGNLLTKLVTKNPWVRGANAIVSGLTTSSLTAPHVKPHTDAFVDGMEPNGLGVQGIANGIKEMGHSLHGREFNPETGNYEYPRTPGGPTITGIRAAEPPPPSPVGASLTRQLLQSGIQ